MKQVLMIVIFTVLLPWGGALGSEWDRTDISFEHVDLSAEKCYADEQAFLGCVAALDLGGKSVDPPQTIVTQAELEAHFDFYGKIIEKYGPVSITEETRIPRVYFRSGRELVALTRQLAKARILSFRNLFAERNVAGNVPFDQIFQKLKLLLAGTAVEKHLAASMINSMLAFGPDRHAHIKPKGQSRRSAPAGIGATIEAAGGFLVLKPFKDSPAEQAGLRKYDVVLEIDGKQCTRYEQFFGPVNSMMRISAFRNGEALSFPVKRKHFELRSITSERIPWKEKTWGHIRVATFAYENICDSLKSAIMNMERARAGGLILDFRGNQGGLLDQAVCSAGLFIGKEVVARERTLLLNREIPHRSSQSKISNLPLVVLLDDQSASGSELFAGAMIDYNRGWIVGDTSFGKSVVQVPITFSHLVPGVEKWVTCGWFYSPAGTAHHRVGISPDFKIELVPGDRDLNRHEEDHYNNSPETAFMLQPYQTGLSDENRYGKSNSEERRRQAREISACLEKTGSGNRVVNPAIDGQVAMALDVLSCVQK